MKSGKYTLRELWADGDAEQFIVPELQRDYVWTSRQIEPLLDNLWNAYEKYQNFTLPNFNDLKENQIKELKKIYRDNNCSCNIGFIYAYYDADVQNRYFLIDGQQRMTTIYLLMAYLAHCDETNLKKFISRYFRKIDNSSKLNDFRNYKLKLDYRVREVAHEFLQHLIFDMMFDTTKYLDEALFNDQTWDQNEKEKEEKITATLKKIPWYHLYYQDDVTVRSFVNNLHAIHKITKKHKNDFLQWFSYLEDYIEFWYFDTNQSSQGEELYIYMNSRGEQLSYNENRRPDFLSSADSIEEKSEFGKKWDEIQNFFWKNRENNPSADKGFNFFLRLVEQLNIAEQDATDDRVQRQLKDFINNTNSDDISDELKIYYSQSKTKEKWNDLIAYSETYSKLAQMDKLKEIFSISSYLTGNIPQKDPQRKFLVFIALLIVFKKQKTIDYNLLNRCNLYFENLMRHDVIENEPTNGSRALFELARNVGNTQDLYELKNYKYQNKLLTQEEKHKLEYLSNLDAFIADERLKFLDDILRDNTLLKGKINLLLRATIDDENNYNENPFKILDNETNRQYIVQINKLLLQAFNYNNRLTTVKELFKIDKYFRYYSAKGTRYPYEFYYNNLSQWHDLFYQDNKPNDCIVKFIKAKHDNKQISPCKYEEVGLFWMQKLISDYGETLCECEKFVLKNNGKINLKGDYPLFGKVSLFADNIEYVKDGVMKILTIDYDFNHFILKITGENDEKHIDILKKDGTWNFDELNGSIKKFREDGTF